MELQAAHIEALRQHLSVEICKAVGLAGVRWSHRPLDWLFRVPTHRFALVGARFDNWVSHLGFAEAARRILPTFVKDFQAYGTNLVPHEGPLLVTSNHPGACDALIIAACVGRDDFKVVTGNIPFLRDLPSAGDHMLMATTDTHQRMGVLRSGIRHLSEGGSLLLFPSGHIDPDPEVLPGGRDALREWSPSVELILRRVPEAQVLVTVVSGVLARACAYNPLTRVRKHPRDRQRVAEFIQIVQQMVLERSFALVPSISFAEPLTLADLREAVGLSGALDALILRAQGLLARHTACTSA